MAAERAGEEFEVPARLGPCVGLTRIGKGAMGAVFRARHEAMGIDVAVKVLDPKLGQGDPKTLQRFVREVRLLATVRDPRVVGIFDAGQEGRFAYAVMELIHGEPLDRIAAVAPGGRLAPGAAAHYLAEVARGLDAVHRRGVVHRDIKPENVLVTAAGQTKIADFGLARGHGSIQLTMVDEVVGTPEYMAPEAISHAEVDGRADLYSLGITGYRLLCGQTPFNQGGLLQIANGHLRVAPVPIRVRRHEVPEGLAAVVMRLLEKDPAARYPTAADAAAALAPYADARPSRRPEHAPPPGPRPAAAPGPGGGPAPGIASAIASGQAPGHAASSPRPTAPDSRGASPLPGPPSSAPAGPASGPAGPERSAPTTGDGGLGLPGWEEVALVKLLVARGRRPLEPALDALWRWQAAGGPANGSFAQQLAARGELEPGAAPRAAEAAKALLVGLRNRIGVRLLSRSERLGPAVSRTLGGPLPPGARIEELLVERGVLAPEDAQALARRIDEGLQALQRRALQQASTKLGVPLPTPRARPGGRAAEPRLRELLELAVRGLIEQLP